MADVAVQAAVGTNWNRFNHRFGPVWINKNIGYLFITAPGANLVYHKTIDGGATWDAAVPISTSTVAAVDVWFDKWTPGDSGTKIHIWWTEIVTDDVHYCNLDTSDDTLGSDVIVYLGSTFSLSSRSFEGISGTKSLGGNLYVQFWGDADGERGFYRSENDGVTWFGRTDGADGDEVDEVICLPDGDSADNQDIVMIYWDRSANELSIKKHDDSLNSWSETSISTDIIFGIIFLQMSAMVRHSDNHVILVAWTEVDSVTADLKVFEITITAGTPTITTKTNIITDTDDVVCCGLLIDQNNNDLYVAYLGNESGAEVVQATLTAFYKKSIDGGDTWGAQQVYQEGSADDMRAIDAGCSTPGIAEGRFEPAFYNDDLFDLIVNKVNSVELLATAGGGGGSHQSSGRGIHRGVLRGVA